jgi:hypothetical protein
MCLVEPDVLLLCIGLRLRRREILLKQLELRLGFVIESAGLPRVALREVVRFSVLRQWGVVYGCVLRLQWPTTALLGRLTMQLGMVLELVRVDFRLPRILLSFRDLHNFRCLRCQQQL